MQTLQFLELTITSFLFAFIIANLVEVWNSELWLVSAIVSFVVWFIAGIRYFIFKNRMLKHKPPQTII